METLVVRYLAEVLQDDGIERRAKNGVKDRGDVTGVKTLTGERVVIEVKDYRGEIHAGTWIREAQVEAANDDAAVAIVVAKRKGKTAPGEQWALMTVRDVAVLFGADLEGGF